jgi:type III restriction enzyme
LEKEFARFLEAADDVERFAKLPERFGFVIEYLDPSGNLRFYEPDFVVVTMDGASYLVETKGMEDVNVASKDRAAQLWCENATLLTGKPWGYLKVQEKEYKQLQPSLFGEVSFLGLK